MLWWTMSSIWTEWKFCQTRNSPSLLPNPVSLCDTFTSVLPARSYLFISFEDWTTHVFGIPTIHSPAIFSPQTSYWSSNLFSKFFQIFIFIFLYTEFTLAFNTCADSILSSATIIIGMIFKFSRLICNVIVQNPTSGAVQVSSVLCDGVSIRMHKIR